MALVKRKHGLDIRNLRWFCLVCLRNYTYLSGQFHRTYAAYGGIFIVMALLWGWIFNGIPPDSFDLIGSVIAVIGVIIIFYAPRKGERAIWSS